MTTIQIKDNKWVWVLFTFVFISTSILLGSLYYKAVSMSKERARVYKEDLKTLNTIKELALEKAEVYQIRAQQLIFRIDSLRGSIYQLNTQLTKERLLYEKNATVIRLLDADSTFNLFTERTRSDRD